MLNAYFVGPTGIRTPASTEKTITIERNRVHLAPGEEAVHERHSLIWQGKVHIVMRIEVPCTVRFERLGQRSAEYGPFDVLTMVDGMLMVSIDAEAPLARFEYSSKSWIEPSTMIVWERVIISSTDAPAERPAG